MARGLTGLFGRGPRRARRAAWCVLVLGVIGVHGCVTRSVADRLSAFGADLSAERAMPSRMEVAFVREMALRAPTVAAAPAAPPVAMLAPRKRRPMASKAASAPEPTPEPKAEPPAPIVATAIETSPEEDALPSLLADAPMSVPDVAASSPEAVAASSPASAASGAAPAFEWPASTRLSYLLTGNYRGEVSGSAQVEWIRVGSHYQVHVDFIVGPKFAPLVTQRSTSEGEITVDGLAPRRYDQEMKFLFQARPRQTVLFDAGNVVLANGDVRPAAPGLQDTASQFVQLAYVFGTRPDSLRVGDSIDIPLALPKKLMVWTYGVVAEEVLQTPFGPLAGIHLKPLRSDQRAGTLAVEMWMAPQLRYLPIRLRFEQDAQTYIDLTISRPPELSN